MPTPEQAGCPTIRGRVLFEPRQPLDTSSLVSVLPTNDHGATSEPRCPQSGKNSDAHNRSENVICVQTHGDEDGAEFRRFQGYSLGLRQGQLSRP